MARKKRASMREGPLADLFRSTEESVVAGGDQGVRQDATGAESRSRSPSRRRPCPSPFPSPRRSRSPSRPLTPSPSLSPAPSRCRSRLRPSRSRTSSIRDPPRGPRAADGRSRASRCGPRYGRDEPSTRPAGRPASRSCRARTRPSCGWWASAARASTPSTGWSRPSCRASSSSRSTPTFSPCRPRTRT